MLPDGTHTTFQDELAFARRSHRNVRDDQGSDSRMTFRLAVKRSTQALALALTLPAALACGFGRILPVYTICAHTYALGPGIIGSYLRAAFYWWTLRNCSIDITISLGTYFVYPQTTVGSMVSIGSYCVIGPCGIGRGTQIASHVEIPGGRHQHHRDVEGKLSSTVQSDIAIGEYCWIGASAIVMASVGNGSTVGAGAVVVKDIPAGVVAVGNPARVLGSAGAAATGPHA
jgi:acetyltransferase-like isoleucine patch superfamily enzyme